MYNFFNNLFKNNSTTSAIEEYVKKGAYLVDVRTPAEFEMGHVPGSVNIPLDVITNYLPVLREKPYILVFCRTGNRSGIAKSILESSGIQNVINGGAWQDVKEIVERLKNNS
ncbi:MAG: rhodanese-like domain-containing protein [Bacteroidia bacterium]|nr:rhodanese-like domain-containing protein [Bacteroidia bacterium]MDW8158208.1 rhodanese-like domain-containing protein [Bacteroidia bacterium]